MLCSEAENRSCGVKFRDAKVAVSEGILRMNVAGSFGNSGITGVRLISVSDSTLMAGRGHAISGI